MSHQGALIDLNFLLSVFAVFWATWMYKLVSLIKFEKLRPLFYYFQMFFFCPILSSPPMNLMIHMSYLLILSHRSYRSSVYLIFLSCNFKLNTFSISILSLLFFLFVILICYKMQPVNFFRYGIFLLLEFIFVFTLLRFIICLLIVFTAFEHNYNIYFKIIVSQFHHMCYLVVTLYWFPFIIEYRWLFFPFIYLFYPDIALLS